MRRNGGEYGTMTNRSDNNDSSTETSTNGKNPKKTLAKRGGTAGGKRVSTLSTPLSSNESYVNGHLSRVALASLAILTFITFVGNFTQLQLSAALPTIVSEFGISVTTGQWLTSIFQLVMGVMVPLTAFLTRRFTTRQIVIVSMTVFAVGSLLAWVGPTFLVVLAGRLLEAVGTGVMWPVLQITVFSIYPLSRRGMAMGAVVANFSPDVTQIMDICDGVTPPIFLLFFVASGADLKLSVLPTVGLIGVIYIVLRVAGKAFGASLGGIVCKCDKNVKKYLGPCLLPQAGVAIGLSLAAGKIVPHFAPQIRAVILCGTLIYELIGPAVTKLSLKKAGEITTN